MAGKQGLFCFVYCLFYFVVFFFVSCSLPPCTLLEEKVICWRFVHGYLLHAVLFERCRAISKGLLSSSNKQTPDRLNVNVRTYAPQKRKRQRLHQLFFFTFEEA